MAEQYAYLFIVVAGMLTVILASFGRFPFSALRSRQFLAVSSVLLVLWVAVEQVALWLGMWHFPPGGTMSVRFLNIPLEEYLFLSLHSVACALLLREDR